MLFICLNAEYSQLEARKLRKLIDCRSDNAVRHRPSDSNGVCVVMYHGGTYPRTLAFEVLNFTHENGWNNKFFIGFHKRTPKFLYSWSKTCKTPTGFFQLLCQMTLAKISSITHRQIRYLPFGRACVLYGELRVKWTCVIFAAFGHGDFLSQNELPKIKIFTAVCLSRVSELPVESLCWVLRVQKIFYALVRR